MISQTQFDSIQMNATTRRIAAAEMVAAQENIDVFAAISAKISAMFSSADSAINPLVRGA